ncbi:MAG: hypothetical protein HYY16_05825 [Planctomycetes bacterium]|nr:hypothetical protein [Planctomycetota bacterium]
MKFRAHIIVAMLGAVIAGAAWMRGGRAAAPMRQERSVSSERPVIEEAALRPQEGPEPNHWVEVIATLAAEEDINRSLEKAAAFQDSLDDAGEAALIEWARTRQDWKAQRLVVAVLSCRDSVRSFDALVGLSASSRDGRVRLAALLALAERRGRAPNDIAAAADTAIARRSMEDSDPGIRDAARKLMPGFVPDHPTPPRSKRHGFSPSRGLKK